MRSACFVVCAGLAGILAAGGCYHPEGQGPGHRPQALALSPEQEWTLGEKAYRYTLSRSRVVRSGPEVERIREIGGRIVKAAEIEPLEREINLRMRGYRWDWEFNLLVNQQVNAFCMPGGKVAVFTGLLQVAENDDQLATVISHEIAHALAHHASERIGRQQKYQHALDAINGALASLDPASRRQLIVLLGAGAQTGILAYDRQQESEADHIGLFLMTFAGYDPAQAIRFWQRMVQRAGGRGSPEILSDHPSDARRINQIRGWIAHAQAAPEGMEGGPCHSTPLIDRPAALKIRPVRVGPRPLGGNIPAKPFMGKNRRGSGPIHSRTIIATHPRPRAGPVMRIRCPGAIIFLLMFGSQAARGDDFYYMLMFGSQRTPPNPNYSHSFATFVHASGEGRCPKALVFKEVFTISWLPVKGRVRTNALFPEAGRNYELHETINWAYDSCERISVWGPYEIDRVLYGLALRQFHVLNSGQVKYKAVDSGYPTNRVSNCIHAVSSTVAGYRLRVASPSFGQTASWLIMRRFEPYVIDPDIRHRWVSTALDLDQYPLIYRDVQNPRSNLLWFIFGLFLGRAI